jgi:hypothetical protein
MWHPNPGAECQEPVPAFLLSTIIVRLFRTGSGHPTNLLRYSAWYFRFRPESDIEKTPNTRYLIIHLTTRLCATKTDSFKQTLWIND